MSHYAIFTTLFETDFTALWLAFSSVVIVALAIFIVILQRRLRHAELKAAQSLAQLRVVIESIPNGLALYDYQDNLLECNQQYCELLDVAKAGLIKQSFESIMRRAATTGVLMDASAETEVWLEKRLKKHRAPRGSFVEHCVGERWVRVSEQRVEGIASVEIRTDITDLKQMWLDLSEAIDEAQQARAVAEEACHAKTTFLANMSHELRTPMNAIIGYSEMLLEDAEASQLSKYAKHLSHILSASFHLLEMIDEILDLTKIEAGKMQLYLEEIDVIALLKEVETTVQPLVAKNANQLLLSCPPTLPSMFTDVTKLRQAIYNLLSNACKFTRHGLITLSVSVEHTADSEGFIFCVADNGVGMSPQQIGRIFDAFIQADNSTTRQYGGTGLGLTITRHFCEMMGGSISVQSQPGMGSSFQMRLPIRVKAYADIFVPQAKLGQPLALVENTSSFFIPSQPDKVLIVEDEFAD